MFKFEPLYSVLSPAMAHTKVVLNIDHVDYTLERRGCCLFLDDKPVNGTLEATGNTHAFIVDFKDHKCINISSDTVLRKLIGAYFLCFLYDVPVMPCETRFHLITIGGVEKKLPPTVADSKLFDFVGLIASPRR
ncbi:MAG: hypothetical protein KGL39_23935 [Patescibacteria group bacterium]|nr:hypothetical protein [Patescibacteria group bacterium]